MTVSLAASLIELALGSELGASGDAGRNRCTLEGVTWQSLPDGAVELRVRRFEAMALRVGVLTDTGAAQPTSAERSAAVEAAALGLEAQGHTLVPLNWVEIEAMVAASRRTFGGIVAVNLVAMVQSSGIALEEAEPLTQAFVARGRAMSGTSLRTSRCTGSIARRGASWSRTSTIVRAGNRPARRRWARCWLRGGRSSRRPSRTWISSTRRRSPGTGR